MPRKSAAKAPVSEETPEPGPRTKKAAPPEPLTTPSPRAGVPPMASLELVKEAVSMTSSSFDSRPPVDVTVVSALKYPELLFVGMTVVFRPGTGRTVFATILKIHKGRVTLQEIKSSRQLRANVSRVFIPFTVDGEEFVQVTRVLFRDPV